MDISVYKQAPDLLLNKLCEVNKILIGQKKSERLQFWKSVAEVMRFAYLYMNELKFIHRQNEILLAENQFLKSYTSDLINKLNAYETIRKEIADGTLNETIETVRKSIFNENNE